MSVHVEFCYQRLTIPPPPMAQEVAPFNLSKITGNTFQNVVDVETSTASQYSPHAISEFNTESGDHSHILVEVNDLGFLLRITM